MNTNVQTALEITTGTIASAVSFQSAILFFLGFVFFLMGCFVAFVFIYSRVKGKKTEGKIIGALHRKRTKTEIRDGKEEEKVKHDRYLVLEYKRLDGSIHQELSSDGLDKKTTYKTGDTINLLVCSHGAYDDVYDANSKKTLIAAPMLLLLGSSMMFPIFSIFGLKNMFWLGLVTILVPIAFKLSEVFSDSKSDKNQRPSNKQFTNDEIQPLEDVLKNWE